MCVVLGSLCWDFVCRGEGYWVGSGEGGYGNGLLSSVVLVDVEGVFVYC